MRPLNASISTVVRVRRGGADIRILNIDIETTPAKAYIWDLKTRYVPPSMVIEPKRMLCFAAKWVGEPRVFFYSTWHDGRLKMVSRVWELLDEADAVLHYNGQRFDIPVINSEFMQTTGGFPPSPFKQIDLYRTVKTRFSFMSNSLDYVSRALGTDTKVQHEGFGLWAKVMAGDVAARKRMRLYNIGDVHANEALYGVVRPWIPQHPSHGIFESGDVCPACGAERLVKRGYAATQLRTYQRYVCAACGKWSRSGKSLTSADIREVAA
jgi:DNA-directed RNA polymerase subunit RPC12/RpoP